ncbi:hypothetical protein Q5752_004477 [Cryptotrichosporon argae]
MSEYWVSKKQYWCKYCDIYIRDDAPSRRLHEAGLKHQGNKERYIRDLYKSGGQAKRDKEEAAKEMARIEAAANKAFANDIGSSHSAFHTPKLHPSASAPARPSAPPADKFANYSTAEQLGLADASAETAYEIEKAIGARPGRAGEWEEVDAGAEAARARAANQVRAQYVDEEKERAETWKLRSEKREREVYGDDDYDPMAALAKVRLKKVENSTGWKTGRHAPAEAPAGAGGGGVEGGLKREGWSGKIELNPDEGAAGLEQAEAQAAAATTEEDVKPAVAEIGDVKPVSHEAVMAEEKPDVGDVKPAAEPPAEGASTSLFKKRRPPPSGRKK